MPPKRPRDPNQLGKFIVDIAVGEVEDRKLTHYRTAASYAHREMA